MAEEPTHRPAESAPAGDATTWAGWYQGLASGPAVSAIARKALVPLASLKLTVVLFVLAIALVFFGTLAQVDEGIWTVVNKYFRNVEGITVWGVRIYGFCWVPLQIFVRFGQAFFGISQKAYVPGAFPFPGGWLIGGLLLINLLAAHAVRFKMSWKRSGILLIHSGLVVMMLSELVAGLFAVEGNMTIIEGEAANYLEDIRASELAVIDPSDSKLDDVVVIPGSILRQGGVIRHELLPFDVEVVRYMVNSAAYHTAKAANSELAQAFPEAPPGTPNRATVGDGRKLVAVERPEVSGTDPNQDVDHASAYVTFKDKGGQSPGTYLVSQWLGRVGAQPQPVTVGGKTYHVELRFKRTYKPYTVHLIDFRHDKYLGTDTPKNFSSQVRLVDPTRNADREVLIYMNHPLRYAGETFFQSAFLPGDRGTILQVVRNPGWLLPYIACAMVSGGMLVHFGMHLFGFLRRRTTR